MQLIELNCNLPMKNLQAAMAEPVSADVEVPKMHPTALSDKKLCPSMHPRAFSDSNFSGCLHTEQDEQEFLQDFFEGKQVL